MRGVFRGLGGAAARAVGRTRAGDVACWEERGFKKVKMCHSHHPSYESGLKQSCSCPKPGQSPPLGHIWPAQLCPEQLPSAGTVRRGRSAAGNAPFLAHPVGRTLGPAALHHPSPTEGWVTGRGTPPALLGTPAKVRQDFVSPGVAEGVGALGLLPLTLQRGNGPGKGGLQVRAAGAAAAHEHLGFCLQGPWAREMGPTWARRGRGRWPRAGQSTRRL